MEVAKCTFLFEVLLNGEGKTLAEAWKDASRNFIYKPGSIPRNRAIDIAVICVNCDWQFILDADFDWTKNIVLTCSKCGCKQSVHLFKK